MFEIHIDKNTITQPITYEGSNRISTTLYNRYNFLPLSVFNQLVKFTNLYFVIIAVLAVIPVISPISPYSAFLPVIFVIMFSVCFDLYDDFKRYLSDQKANSLPVRIIRDGVEMEVTTEDVRVGDLALVEEGGKAVADIVLLTYRGVAGYGYIDTSSLDGEKSLKPKISVLPSNIGVEPFLGSGKRHGMKPEDVDSLEHLHIVYKTNNINLSNFEATCNYKLESTQERRLRLDINNFIPRSANFRNTISVVGLVVYIGHDTKVMRNMQKRIFKESTVEILMNRYILKVVGILVVMLIFISIYSVASKSAGSDYDKIYDTDTESYAAQFFIKFFQYFVIMNTILPISLIVTLQLVKVVQKWRFEKQDIYKDPLTGKRAVIRTVNIHEELGMIQYILSDKTGTLTQNKMITQYFHVLDSTIDVTGSTLKKIENRPFKPFTLISKDSRASYRVPNSKEAEFLYFMIINCCHDCFSTTQDDEYSEGLYEQLKRHIAFEGPSPDEIALLSASKNYCGYLHKGSDSRLSIIYTANNENIEILKRFTYPFDSDRKLMSVIVNYKGTNFMLVKGADSSVKERLVSQPSAHFEDCITNFIHTGLRVMYLGIKVMSDDEVDGFLHQLDSLERIGDSNGYNRAKLDIEYGLSLIGATAIEDKLQENLRSCITTFRTAMIKIWVITGDKGETAKNIAYSAGLFVWDHSCDEIRLEDLDSLWSKQLNPGNNNNLLVNGDVLAEVLRHEDTKETFTNHIMQYECVVFCRTNPTQKVEIVRLLKNKNKIVLSVGDGANDVNMIQEANVGVGIMGEEGKQAENASDFAIPRFEMLRPLILHHGRLSYYRNTQMILYFFYKNFLFTIPQFIFSFYCYFTAQPFYKDWYISFFNLLFTATPVPGRAVTDIDIDNRASYYQPDFLIESYVYFLGQQNLQFNLRKFMFWLLGGTIESVLGYYFVYGAFYMERTTGNHESTYDFVSIMYYSFVVFYTLIKLVYLSKNFTPFYYLAIFLGFAIYILYFIVTNYMYYYGYFYANLSTWGQGTFYMSLIFLISAMFVFTLTYFSIKKEFFPTIKDKILRIRGTPDDVTIREYLDKWRQQEVKGGFIHRLIN